MESQGTGRDSIRGESNQGGADSRTSRAVISGIRTFAISRMIPRKVGQCPNGANVDGEYIDLSLNPERFTGYAGDSAHQVWRAIYEENCFGLSEAGAAAAPIGFSKLSEGWGTEMVKQDEECEEKRVYYRIISG